MYQKLFQPHFLDTLPIKDKIFRCITKLLTYHCDIAAQFPRALSPPMSEDLRGQGVTSPMFIVSAHHSGANLLRLNNFKRTVAAPSLERESGEFV